LLTQISCKIAHFYTASTFLIRILSDFILVIDRAIAIETASGRPSGMATIKIQMATMAILITLMSA
jgi:hypothetical protein